MDYRRQSSLLEALSRLNSQDIKSALDEITGNIHFLLLSTPKKIPLFCLSPETKGFKMRWKAVKDFLRIALICCMWYVVSTANGIIGK